MRKVSKSRMEDDVISSTNGSSGLNDNQIEKEITFDGDDRDDDEAENIDDSKDDDLNDDDYSEKPKTTPGKRGRPSKKKSKSENNKSKATEEEFEVEKIIDAKKIKGKLHYLIRWKGYSADNDTWEPANTVSCPDLINKFNEEKESAKSKEPKKSSKKALKRKGKTEKKITKRPKNEWDSENADENAEYEVDRILEVHHKKNGKREFLIHWKGWSNKFDSWEPESNLNCPDLIKRFMDKVSSAKSKDSRNLRVAPETTNRFTLQDPSSGRRLSKRRGQRQRVRYDDAE